MAFYPELTGPALEAYRTMVNTLRSRAMKELNLGADDIVVRELRPADFDLGSTDTDYAIGLTAVTWTEILNKTVPDNRFIGIHGFYAINSSTVATNNENVVNMGQSYPNSPTIEQVRITRKGSVARYYTIGAIANFEHHVGYTDEPITVDQNTTIKIEGLARYAGSLQGRFNILGVVAEKKGILISP